MATTPQSEQQTEQLERSYVLEVCLTDGEEITADAGNATSARTGLADLHMRLDTDTFVLLGEELIVRSSDVRYVRIRENDGEAGGGLIGSVRQRLGGGEMSAYETQRRGATARRAPSSGGVLDEYVGYGRRPWSETKPFFMTSEFLTLVGAVAAVAVAMAVSDVLDGDRGWLLITILAAAYMISRGLAKSGTKDPRPGTSGDGDYG